MRDVELLAPVGSFEALKAAVQNGQMQYTLEEKILEQEHLQITLIEMN